MISKEKILFSLKKKSELREEVVKFAMTISNLPESIIEESLTDYLNDERNRILELYEGKRSMTGLRYLWDAEPIAVHHADGKPIDATGIRLNDKPKQPIVKPLLQKNVKVCPSCDDTDTYLYERYENNGVIGPGYSSWVVESYWICNECGIHFNPKEKK